MFNLHVCLGMPVSPNTSVLTLDSLTVFYVGYFKLGNKYTEIALTPCIFHFLFQLFNFLFFAVLLIFFYFCQSIELGF